MKLKNNNKYIYPEEVTENFDGANFHIRYCLSFLKKYLTGDILEVGAGCGSFTRSYYNNKINSLILTERDKKNILDLEVKFRNNKRIKVKNIFIKNIKKKFDVILYLHVLEHIKNDLLEIKQATKKLKRNGILVIMSPAHQKMYSNLDKIVNHYRRYHKDFFLQKFNELKLIELRYLDASGYVLYYLNKIFFKKEGYPSKFKIFIWDKFFTPISIIVDFILRYKVGKCILATYKKY